MKFGQSAPYYKDIINNINHKYLFWYLDFVLNEIRFCFFQAVIFKTFAHILYKI
ncbi:hypothetical protein AO377_0644 [Moraxella catarrhalis]|nr:hypothetical protein AO377_0644 [Moraxella catarrhalis]